MSHSTTAILFTGVSLLALAVLVHAVREARRAEDVDAATVLAFATGLLVIAPDLLVALTSWLEGRTGAALNVVSQDPSDLAIEPLARSGQAAVLVVRRYATASPSDGLTYRSMSPAPFVDLVVEDLSKAGAQALPDGGELI